MFFPFISHFTSPGSICSGWGEGQPRCDLGQVSEGPVWNKLFLGTGWGTEPQSSVVAPPVGHSSSWCAQGTENSKEELLWFIKCSCITVSNELPVRHSASFELMGTLITSRCKCSCVVKTWRCHTAFWTRSGVLQQSSSFSLLSHLQDGTFSVPSEPGSWKHSALFPSASHQVKLAKRNDAREVRLQTTETVEWQIH